MSLKLVALLAIGLLPWAWAFPSSVQAQGTLSYDQEVQDLLDGAKRRHGTADQEAALQGQLESRVDPTADATSDQKVLISEQDKAANPYYAMITSGKSDLKSCNIERTVEIYTGQHLKEIQGDFWVKGIEYHDDLRRCQVERRYEPYQVTLDDPPIVWEETRTWSKTRYGDGRQGWGTAYRYDGRVCYDTGTRDSFPVGSSTEDCYAAMEEGISCSGTLARVGTTAGPKNMVGVSELTTTWTCTIPQNHQETRLREVIDDRCADLAASCQQLEDNADAGGCRTISGIERCPDWWMKDRLYSCHQNHECSAWPTSEEECGAWFAADLTGCRASMDTGVQAIALRKFSNVEGNLSCAQFSMEDLMPTSNTEMVEVTRTREVPKIVEKTAYRDVNTTRETTIMVDETRTRTVMVDETRTRQVPVTTTETYHNGYDCVEGTYDDILGTRGWVDTWWSPTNSPRGGYYVIEWECGVWKPDCNKRWYHNSSCTAHYDTRQVTNYVTETYTVQVPKEETYTVQVPKTIQEVVVVQEPYTVYETVYVEETYTEMVPQTTTANPDYSLLSSSPFFAGCGVFQAGQTDKFRLIGSGHTKLAASCTLADQPLPPGILDQREDLQDVPGEMRVRYLTFDYHTETVVDGCRRMTEDLAEQGVICELVDEMADGVPTYQDGVPLSSEPPESCRTFTGSLQDYELCREFWRKERKYRCEVPPVDPKATDRRVDTGLSADPEPDGPTDAPGFETALGSLAVADELAKATSSDRDCAAPNPDGSCNKEHVRLFSGEKNSCKQWSPDLQMVNYHCCKANLRQQCEGMSSPNLCLDFCQAEDVATSELVHDQKVCQKTGTYCSDKRCIGATVNGQCIGYWQCFQKRTTYCCFDSVLARLLQQQGRNQLNKPWGSVEFPNCEGYTIDEFLQLDIASMDLNEFIDSIAPDPKAIDGSAIDPQAIQQQLQQSVTEQEYEAP